MALRLLSKRSARRCPIEACFAISSLITQLGELNTRIGEIDDRLVQIHRNHPVCRLLASIPGVGPTTATAFAATIPNPLRARIRICRVARWAPCS
ncbi:MAG: hypothetical protein EOS06_27240 [Mesorhizobium sp.]|nr:MAG: hypothetical protein EOS06_27240 [Mesorhizobium sp.]TJU72502.1 MAG: hypothetical protein E5Y15_33860 [Mesorhizobium sp.]